MAIEDYLRHIEFEREKVFTRLNKIPILSDSIVELNTKGGLENFVAWNFMAGVSLGVRNEINHLFYLALIDSFTERIIEEYGYCKELRLAAPHLGRRLYLIGYELGKQFDSKTSWPDSSPLPLFAEAVPKVAQYIFDYFSGGYSERKPEIAFFGISCHFVGNCKILPNFGIFRL